MTDRELELRLDYWRARRTIQWIGLVGGLLAFAVAALIAVLGGPWWAAAAFAAVTVFDGVLATGWVPRRFRVPMPPLPTRRLPNRADHQ